MAQFKKKVRISPRRSNRRLVTISGVLASVTLVLTSLAGPAFATSLGSPPDETGAAITEESGSDVISGEKSEIPETEYPTSEVGAEGTDEAPESNPVEEPGEPATDPESQESGLPDELSEGETEGAKTEVKGIMTAVTPLGIMDTPGMGPFMLCETGMNGLVTVKSGNVTVNLDKANSKTWDIWVGAWSGDWDCMAKIKTLTFINSPKSPVKSLGIGGNSFLRATQLTSVSFPSNLDELYIGSDAFRGSPLKSVTFGSNVGTLTIKDSAFLQHMEDPSVSYYPAWGRAPTLEKVTFGSTTNVTIGSQAFAQRPSRLHTTALKTVIFSRGIQNLDIGDSAFMLGSGEAAATNSLASISFPDGMKTLRVGERAFQQNTYRPEGNRLASVSIPGTLTSLRLGGSAFANIYGSGFSTTLNQPQAKLTFRASKVPTTAARSITLGDAITWDRTDWYWEGADNVKVEAAWKSQIATIGAAVSFSSTGYRVYKPYVLRHTNPAASTAARLSGQNRYETNYQVNVKTMQAGKPLFVATGAKFPDALSVGPAVAVNQGSLVLSPQRSMDAKILELIKSKKPSAVYIIGGESAISDNVVKQLKAATGKTPERIAGSNRYKTSAAIFDKFFSNRKVTGAFVATGADFPDALSAASAGGALGMPVLLVDGKNPRVGLEASMVKTLKNRGVKSVVIVGGDTIVTNKVQANIANQGFTVTRKAGSTRYATNLAVNDYVNSKTGGATSITGVWVATGKNFPDALSAAVPAGQTTQRLVLSNGSCVSKPVVSTWINGSGSKVKNVTLVGATSVLNANVANLTQCK